MNFQSLSLSLLQYWPMVGVALGLLAFLCAYYQVWSFLPLIFPLSLCLSFDVDLSSIVGRGGEGALEQK